MARQYASDATPMSNLKPPRSQLRRVDIGARRAIASCSGTATLPGAQTLFGPAQVSIFHSRALKLAHPGRTNSPAWMMLTQPTIFDQRL